MTPKHTDDFTLATIIIDECANHFGVRRSRVAGRGRTKTVTRARHMAMLLIWRETDLSLTEIATIFCRHHSTVIAARDRMRKAIRDPAPGDWALVGSIQVRRAAYARLAEVA